MIDDDQLSEQERRVVSATRTGEVVDLSVGDDERDDPAHAATWDGTRTVAAGLLIKLLTSERAPGRDRPRAIKIRGARITGRLDLEGLHLACPLLLHRCYVDEPINLNQATAPAIRLPGCHIPGLSAAQLRTGGNLELNNGFTATGEINLLGAHIGGILSFDGARLTNPGGYALTAVWLTVDQSMSCGQRFTATGEVSLLSANISGYLAFDGAQLDNPGGQALNAPGITLDQDMYCRVGFTATGEVNVSGAHISGILSFDGAQLDNPDGQALNAPGITVGKGMFCGEGFTATGEINLLGAHIGGPLVITQASLNNPKGLALNLATARAALLGLQPAHPPKGAIDLTNAQVGSFYDDQATWPVELRLRGFTYETLEDDRASTRDRLSWLTLHPGGYTPQIYDQLAAAYRRAGNIEAARKVGVAKQRRRRHVLSPLNWLLYGTVGYGYRTWLAGIWLAVLTVIGAQVFSRAYPHHMIQATPKATAFHAIAYTLDVLLPMGDLGQEKAWIPQGWARDWAWFLIGAGWFLTTAAVAGLTGIFKRD